MYCVSEPFHITGVTSHTAFGSMLDYRRHDFCSVEDAWNLTNPFSPRNTSVVYVGALDDLNTLHGSPSIHFTFVLGCKNPVFCHNLSYCFMRWGSQRSSIVFSMRLKSVTLTTPSKQFDRTSIVTD